VHKFYGGTIPQAERDVRLWEQIVTIEAKFMAQMEKVEIKEALRTLLQLSNLGNKHFQDNEPWRKVKENPNEAQNLIFNLSYLVRDIALLAEIFIPTTSATLLAMFNSSCHWAQLGATTGLSSLNRGEVLFKYLEPEVIENLRCRFAGKQEERETMHDEIKKNEQNEVAERIFSNTIDLRAATISAIERHSDAENLYILQLDVGTELGARQIVSSIVPFYSKEDLLGKTIVLVSNLKKAKFRGTLSEGMLMAAEHTGDEHPCEVVFTQATAGTRFLPQGMADEVAKRNISISLFENFPMQTTNGLVNYKGKVLTSVDGQHSLKTYKYLNDPMG
jgi:methionyl-tRNA synthetase